VLLFVTAFVYLEGAAPRILIFGAIDFASAMWTVSALRADAREGGRVPGRRVLAAGRM
jgi:hypothetical protein